MPSSAKKPLRAWGLSEEEKSMCSLVVEDFCWMAARMVLKCLRIELRTERKDIWKLKRRVGMTRDSEVRRSMAASFMTLKTPR